MKVMVNNMKKESEWLRKIIESQMDSIKSLDLKDELLGDYYAILKDIQNKIVKERIELKNKCMRSCKDLNSSIIKESDKYYEEQLMPNIESILKSALSTYKFQSNNDISINKIKDDVNRIISKYLIYNNSDYNLTNNDIIVESDEYDYSVVNIKFSDELLDTLRNLDKIIIR